MSEIAGRSRWSTVAAADQYIDPQHCFPAYWYLHTGRQCGSRLWSLVKEYLGYRRWWSDHAWLFLEVAWVYLFIWSRNLYICKLVRKSYLFQLPKIIFISPPAISRSLLLAHSLYLCFCSFLHLFYPSYFSFPLHLSSFFLFFLSLFLSSPVFIFILSNNIGQYSLPRGGGGGRNFQ